MATHKYIKFTGDYSKLKYMGYTFQKLYAGNYMQWAKQGGGEWSPTTRVWKKGADVTIDCLTNYEGAFFELYTSVNPLPWYDLSKAEPSLRVVTNNQDCSVSFDNKEYFEQERKNQKHFQEGNEDAVSIILQPVWVKQRDLKPLDDLIKLGWVELAEVEVQD